MLNWTRNYFDRIKKRFLYRTWYIGERSLFINIWHNTVSKQILLFCWFNHRKKKCGRNDYGRTGLWTKRSMDELVYGRNVSKSNGAEKNDLHKNHTNPPPPFPRKIKWSLPYKRRNFSGIQNLSNGPFQILLKHKRVKKSPAEKPKPQLKMYMQFSILN